MFDISLLAVAVAGLVPLLLGMVWYHPKVFGTAWMNIVGITPDMAEKAKSRMFPMMGIALVASLVFAYVLAHFSLAWGVFDWRGGLELGFWIWLGFQVPILLSPVLWDKVFGIDHIMMNVVPQFFLQHMKDGPERVPFVMAEQMFNVFKDKRFWLMPFDNLGHLEKQDPLVLVLKSVFPAKA